MADPEDTIGIEDAATMLRLGLDATRELVDTGQLPALRLNQKHAVLLREVVLDYIREEGRRQAEERRKAAIGKSRTPKHAAPSASPRPRRHAVPDLRAYENPAS